MFGFRKKTSDAPPDVGQEDEYDESAGSDSFKGVGGGGGDDSSEPEVKPVSPGGSSGGGMVSGGAEFEKIDARIDSVVEWIKQFYDRFSYVSESIGEIRNMNITNEKNISKAMAEAEKVIDVVKEVKPEELRLDYQKISLKVATLLERIEANGHSIEEVMGEMKDLRRKSEIFVGTESLMKLNEDTKKDLIEVQKINSAVKMQADKSQEIFLEVRKGFAESQKIGGMIGNLDASYSGLKESLEKLRLDHAKVVQYKDYEDFKKTYENKLIALDGVIPEVKSLKKNVDEIGGLIETSLAVGRINKDDIGKIAVAEGVSDVKGINEYENQMADMVGIIEVLSTQVGEMRKKMEMDKIAPAKKVLPVIKKKIIKKVAPVVEKKVSPVEKKVAPIVKLPEPSSEVVLKRGDDVVEDDESLFDV